MRYLKPGLVITAAISIILILICSVRSQPIMLTEDIGNLEMKWLFRTDPDNTGLKEGWSTPEYNDSSWRIIKVPGYWEDQGVGKEDSSIDQHLPGYDGTAWYRLHFITPAAWADKNLILNLGSVDDQDQVFLNGKLVGETGPGIEQSVLIQRQYKIDPQKFLSGRENILSIRVFDGGGPGGIMGPFVSLLPESVVNVKMTLPQSNRPLEERFADPSADSRILKIIHSWPDEPESQDTLIHSLIAQGFGGVVCNVSFDDYLKSQKKWDALKRALDTAKGSGMAMWLYDEKGYPSGTAGGQTMIGLPEWEVSGLIVADQITDGPQVQLDVPAGKLVLAAAYPISAKGIDLSRKVDLSSAISNDKLSWKPKSGRWHVMVITNGRLYDHTFAAASFGDRIPYINLLMQEPTAKFIELTHNQYAKHLGNDLSKYFISTFTDEPSLMNRWVDTAPYRALPWSPTFAAEFKKLRGYDLQPLIPVLVADAGTQSARVRYDFWQTVGDLVSQNFFGQIQDWCRQHNIRSGGHLVQEEPLLDHVAFYGNFFQCLRRMDAPSIDCLTSVPSQVPPHIARFISSAADLEGKTVTMSETSDFAQIYRSEGDTRPVTNVTTDEMRGTCNRLMLGGINTITSYYSFTGISSKEIKSLNEWVGRCCTMLRGGNHASEIAVLYPVESIWPKFNPARSGATDSPSALEIENIFNSVSDTLYTSCREFSYVDSKAIIDSSVENGYLVNGKLKWRVVILPCADTLPMSAWNKLADFQKNGGILIAVGALPTNSEKEFPSAQVKTMARSMFGQSSEPKLVTNAREGIGVYLPGGSEIQLPFVLNSLIEPDVTVVAKHSPVRMTHRSIDGHEVFFIINDSNQPWKGNVSVAASGTGEFFDITNGRISPLAGPDKISLDLQPCGAVIVRFSKARPLKLHKIVNGSFNAQVMIPLPNVEPAAMGGEFVRATMIEDPEHKQAWKVTGTLTKSNTDTFTFLAFNYPQTVNLGDANLISFDTWVPDGQQSSARLLVMLHEKNGGDYFVDSGRTLNLAGYKKIIIPFNRLQLGPWNKDADGRLNLKQIDRIVIGWGGYFGKEGETVQFTAGKPNIRKFEE